MKKFTSCVVAIGFALALGSGLALAKDEKPNRDQGKHLGQIKNADKGEKVGHEKPKVPNAANPGNVAQTPGTSAGTPAPRQTAKEAVQQAAAAPSGTYTLTVAPTARLKSRGTSKDVSSGELKAGSKVGDIEITPEVAAKLEAAIPRKLDVTPDARNPFKLMVSVDGKPGEAVLYNPKERTFLWGKITNAKPAAGGKCGQIEGASVKGRFTPDFSAIENGEINTGFIAGCHPIVVQADVTYFFTGAR